MRRNSLYSIFHALETMSATEEPSKWANAVNQWYVSSAQRCKYRRDRELMVGDIVTIQTIPAQEQYSNELYIIEKIEYANGNVSFLELATRTTSIGNAPAVDTSHHDNWLRVNMKETLVSLHIDDSCVPNGVLQATAQLKTKLAISSMSSGQSASSVIATALVPALDCFDQTTQALLGQVSSLFSVTSSTENNAETGTTDGNENECKSGESVKESPAISVGLQVEDLVTQYRVLFNVVSQLAVVIACYVDIMSVNTYAHGAIVSKRAEALESALIVQDMEHDATPVKHRAASNSTVKSPNNMHSAEFTIATVLERLCATLDKCVLLVAAHPRPIMVTTAAWAQNIGAVQACVATLNVLADMIQCQYSVFADLLDQFNIHRSRLDEALSAQFDGTGSSIVSFYELCMVDNIVRQDWASHSKYMRDKKFTHGIVALYTSLRTSIWDMYRSQSKSRRSVLGTIPGPRSTLCLQLLLNSTLVVCRTYMGVTELSAADCAELSLTDNAVRMLQPSRVRTAQWSKDLSYTAYMVLDTLAWIITQDTILATRSGGEGSSGSLLEQLYANAANDRYEVDYRGTVNVAQREALLMSAQYTTQASIIRNLLHVLRYMLLGVFIVSEPDSQRVLAKLTQTMSNVEPPDAHRSVINNSSSVEVWQSLLEVTGSLSHFDTLTELFTTGIVTAEGDPAVHRSQVSPDSPPVSVAVVKLPTTAFSTTVDVVSHCGMHAFHIKEHNAAELGLYTQELAQHTAAAAKDGGAANRLSVEKVVMHQRIASMTVTRPQCLLRLLSEPEGDTFLSVFMEVNCVPTTGTGESGGAQFMQRKFTVEMLSRRYEVNSAVYPALTDNEAAAAANIRQHITELLS